MSAGLLSPTRLQPRLFNSMPPYHLDTVQSEKFMLLWKYGLHRVLFNTLGPLLLMAGPALADDAVRLQTQCQKGDLSRVTVSLDVQGELTITAAGKRQKLPMTVAGSFAYDEMRLDDCTNRVNRKAARFYRGAEARITIEKQPDNPALRDDRRLILVNSGKDGVVISALGGPLLREELDLIDLPGNSLMLDTLLPQTEVKTGDSWKPDPAAIGRLLGIDAVAQSDLRCTLADRPTPNVEILIRGQVSGAAAGVATELDVQGKALFDSDRNRLVSIQLRIKERRSAGFVSPGFDVIANLKMEIATLSGSDQLTHEIIDAIPVDKSEIAPPLQLRSAPGAFQLVYDRRWQVTRNEADLTVFRLLDRGELVAQCNISPVAKLPIEQGFSLEQFQGEVEQALGKHFGHFESASERKTGHGLRLLKVVAEGAVADLPIQWRYYLAIDQEGRRIALTYTLEPKLIERFADADAMMIDSLEILASAVAASP
jgi:hypothetical protein